MYGREGRKETYCRRLSIRTRSHHMILMTIKASLFSLFQQPEQKKEQLKPGMDSMGSAIGVPYVTLQSGASAA